jgi:hypothetical protein
MKKKKNYTRNIHIKRLRGMLKKKEPCDFCPAAPRYKGHYADMWWNIGDICKICKEFAGLTAKHGCPCHTLGHEEALKRTHLALEEEG